MASKPPLPPKKFGTLRDSNESPPSPGDDDPRKKIVNEIKSTELSYIQALEAMIVYQNGLLQVAETEQLSTVSKRMIREIFLNIEQLLPINQHLYNEICPRIDNWHATQLIGDIFLQMSSFYKVYNNYGNYYDNASEVLTKARLQEQFNFHVERISKTVKAVSLENLLIQPVQRIPRYILLLSDLMRKTDQSHPDYENLKKSIAAYENVMVFLDQNITHAQNMHKFANQMTKIKGGSNLITASRTLVCDGVINIKNKQKEEASKKFGFVSKTFPKDTIKIWLFNDVLVHLKSSKKKKTNVSSTEYTWPLELVWVQDSDKLDQSDPKMPYTFMLVGPQKVYHLKFPDAMEKNTWLKTLRDGISKAIEGEKNQTETIRYGKYKFPRGGGEYEGWWKFGRIHGEGVFKFFGNRYSGQWEYNFKNGIGTQEFITGEIYYGEWKDNQPNGYGQLQYTNGDRYEGEFKESSYCGKGVLYYANGDSYNGEWANNSPNGEGCYRTASGYLYAGSWVNGKLHGYGMLIAPNSKCYEGQFYNGQKHGEGKLDYGNGDFYIGQWQNDKRHGMGIFVSVIEGVYEGYYVQDKKEGNGKMTFKTGDVYEGLWKRDKFHGHGILTCVSGGMQKYEGTFDQGKMSGKGSLFYRNGSRFDGHFQDDMIHGTGMLTSSNSVLFDGKWEDGRKNGKSTLIVGPSKFPSVCKNGLMSEGEKSFMVQADVPVVFLDL